MRLDDTVWEREFDLRVVELLDVDSSSLGSWDNVNGDDVERSRPDTVPGGHVSVACGDGISLCELTVFTVPGCEEESRWEERRWEERRGENDQIG